MESRLLSRKRPGSNTRLKAMVTNEDAETEAATATSPSGASNEKDASRDRHCTIANSMSKALRPDACQKRARTPPKIKNPSPALNQNQWSATLSAASPSKRPLKTLERKGAPRNRTATDASAPMTSDQAAAWTRASRITAQSRAADKAANRARRTGAIPIANI